MLREENLPVHIGEAMNEHIPGAEFWFADRVSRLCATLGHMMRLGYNSTELDCGDAVTEGHPLAEQVRAFAEQVRYDEELTQFQASGSLLSEVCLPSCFLSEGRFIENICTEVGRLHFPSMCLVWQDDTKEELVAVQKAIGAETSLLFKDIAIDGVRIKTGSLVRFRYTAEHWFQTRYGTHLHEVTLDDITSVDYMKPSIFMYSKDKQQELYFSRRHPNFHQIPMTPEEICRAVLTNVCASRV